MVFAKFLPAIGMAVALAVSSTALAKEWKAVRIGTDATFPPFESVNSSGEIVGFEVEYAKALCEKMKVACAFQNQDWDGIVPALLSGKFDAIVSSMNITPARAKQVMFSDVYYATPPVWVTTAANKGDDTSPEALKGKAIGTQSSTMYANYLDKNYKGSDVKLYPSGDEPFLDLANGRIDYSVGDILVAEKILDKNPGCCRIIKEIPNEGQIFGPGVGAAFRPSDAELRDMFNKAIAEADADGTYKRIASKYFKADIRGK